MMRNMRSFFAVVLAVSAVTMSGVVADGQIGEGRQTFATEYSDSSSEINVSQEHQRRKLTWDFFGFLMMMVSGECSDMHLGDHHLCHDCTGIHHNMNACDKLCSMSSTDARKVSYSRFCDSGDGSSGSSSSSSSSGSYVNEASDSSYNGNTTPGGIGQGDAYSKGFQWWMLAMGAAVVMALVAIIMGQRKDNSRNKSERSMMTGAVGRRFTAVTAFADGIFPTKTSKAAAVEMSSAAAVGSGARASSGDYQLDGDDATAPVDVDNMSTASPEQHPSEEGVEQSYVV